MRESKRLSQKKKWYVLLSLQLIPKPSTRYCFVCREKFNDYLKVLSFQTQHMAHPVHQKNGESLGYQARIEELIEDFNRKQRHAPSGGFAEASESGRKRVKQRCIYAGWTMGNVRARKMRYLKTLALVFQVQLELSKPILKSTDVLTSQNHYQTLSIK